MIHTKCYKLFRILKISSLIFLLKLIEKNELLMFVERQKNTYFYYCVILHIMQRYATCKHLCIRWNYKRHLFTVSFDLMKISAKNIFKVGIKLFIKCSMQFNTISKRSIHHLSINNIIIYSKHPLIFSFLNPTL